MDTFFSNWECLFFVALTKHTKKHQVLSIKNDDWKKTNLIFMLFAAMNCRFILLQELYHKKLNMEINFKK